MQVMITDIDLMERVVPREKHQIDFVAGKVVIHCVAFRSGGAGVPSSV
jgi:hypothetical protein